MATHAPGAAHAQGAAHPRPELGLIPYGEVAAETFAPPVEIAAGVLWLKLGLPMRLDHVNVWLLADGPGWTIVDCGPDTPACRAFWEQAARTVLLGRPVRRLLVTHGHLDHVGAAGWLMRRLGIAELLMTPLEWRHARATAELARDGAGFVAFLCRHGLAAAAAHAAHAHRAHMLRLLGPVPACTRYLAAGERLRIGGADWTVATGSGHSPQHALLHDPERGLLIAGDQVLPSITPVVPLLPETGTDDDPLGDFLATCRRLAGLPAGTIVLPGHGVPFRSLRQRLAYLQAHHEERLATLAAAVAVAGLVTGFTMARHLFPRAVDTEHGWIALCETLAHLRRLQRTGALIATADADGQVRYRHA